MATYFSDSIVASISACHAEDLGSIPSQRNFPFLAFKDKNECLIIQFMILFPFFSVSWWIRCSRSSFDVALLLSLWCHRTLVFGWTLDASKLTAVASVDLLFAFA